MKLKASQETVQAEIKAAIIASQDEMVMISASREKMEVTIRVGQEKLEAMTSYIWYIQADLKKPSANGRGNLMLK
jgi:maltodextrin utilization protein YvdJ